MMKDNNMSFMKTEYVLRRKRWKAWQKIVSCLACIVVFVTTYALILPAITMEVDTFCGQEEHVHTLDECYEEILICQQSDTEPHVHSEVCIEKREVNVCGLEEVEPHTHTEACYERVTVGICGEEEYDAHYHDADCWTQQPLVACGLEEMPDHFHGPDCFTTEMQLACGLEESEEHTHDDGCYQEVTRWSCTQPETLGHTHSEACYTYEDVLLCTQPEGLSHHHDDSCFTEEDQLICGREETAGHIHTEECIAEEQEYICGLEENAVHVHEKETCFEQKMICEKEEHEHSLPCYSDPEADLETEEIWKRSLPHDEELTGNWNEDVLTVAKSQLGYAESVRNYQVVDDEMKGYTRYGAWYGDPYGDWCGMFASFCLRYAGVGPEFMPIESDPQSWIGKLSTAYHSVENYTPVPGDLVFIRAEDSEAAGRVGIVSEVLLREDESVEKLIAIEGDAADRVDYVEYKLPEDKVIGYGQLPENPDLEEIPGETEEAAYSEGTRTFEGEDYTVTVSFTAEAEVPEEAELRVEEYAKDSETYRMRFSEVCELNGWPEDSDYDTIFRLFNIGLFVEEEELEPKAEIQVTITYKDIQELDSTCQVTHFGEETETLDAVTTGENGEVTIEFQTESFSDYGVSLLADNGISLLAAGDDEANLLAYFSFDDNLNDSSGNGASATIKDSSGNTTSASYGWVTTVEGHSLKLADRESGKYLTVTKSDGSSLLAGYDELKFDFWIYPYQNGPNWGFYAAPNSNQVNYGSATYIGTIQRNNYINAERFYNGYNNGATVSVTDSKIRTGAFYHVIVEYSATQSIESVYDSNNNLIAKSTVNNDKKITEILGDNGILQIGKANWDNGEYFNGFLDEFKIYGKVAEGKHVNEKDEIAHVAGVNSELTGLAQITYTGVSDSTDHVAPVPSEEGSTKHSLHFDRNSELNFKNQNGGTLYKGKGYNELELDFWAYLQKDGGSSDYGLFYFGSDLVSKGQRYITASVDQTDSRTVHISYSVANKPVQITCSEDLNNKLVHYKVIYSDTVVTMFVLDEQGNLLGSGNLNVRYGTDTIFGQNYERFSVGVNSSGNHFSGYMDEIKVYARNYQNPTVPDGTRHPAATKTGEINVTGVYLFNIDLSEGNKGAPLSGVTYSVWLGTDTSGEPFKTYTTSDECLLQMPDLEAGKTYTVKQTGVPDGYMVVNQTTTFTVRNSENDMTEVGMFFDYKTGERYEPDKTAEVVDYNNRIYDITLSAKSGAVKATVEPKNFIFVVDQSNSMLFPSKLVPTGATVDLYRYYAIGFDDALHSGGNSARMDQAIQAAGLPEDGLYYIITNESTTATVYALWKSSNGYWYYQDASYYAHAQAGTGHTYSDVNNGNGCINGINRSGLGSDLGLDIQINGGVDAGVGGQKKTYTIYKAADGYNRLTYLKYAMKRMLYELAEMDSSNVVTVVGFDASIEGCITRQIDKQNYDNVDDIVRFVDSIVTSNGTSQNYGLWHTTGVNPTNGANHTDCTADHLADVEGKPYVVLITDGALNDPEAKISGATQEEDLYLAAEAIRNRGAGLITIGLSVQNVTMAKKDLADINHGGIASPGMSFLDKDADELSEQLTNSLLGTMLRYETIDSEANLRDYISDSFYLVDGADTENITALNVDDWITLQGMKVDSTSSDAAGKVGHDDKGWYVEWTEQELKVDSRWNGKIYVKAKEDFIGGNSIDTNKSAEIELLSSSKEVDATINLPSPNVNVRLLPMNQVISEETVFLGDTIEQIQEKIQQLFAQLKFSKILDNGDAVHNKSAASETTYLDNRTFDVPYAAGVLTDSQWQTLFGEGTVTIDYTYDDDSSHGRVGEFILTLEKTGSNTTENHEATIVGAPAETYTLNVEFRADTIGEAENQRPANVHNYGYGPGTEVGGEDAGTTLETGKGVVPSENVHKVNVVDGKITIIKEITDDLKDNENDQTFTFQLTKDGEPYVPQDESGNPIPFAVTVKAGEEQGTIEISNLPRGSYEITETTTDLFLVDKMEIVDETNCVSSAAEGTDNVWKATFVIGTDQPASEGAEGTDVITKAQNTVPLSYKQYYSWLRNEESTPENPDGVSYGTVKVTNKKAVYYGEIPVEKIWHQVPEGYNNDLTVYVGLYQNDRPVIDAEDFQLALALTAGTDWKGTFRVVLQDKDAEVSTLGYSVRELSKVGDKDPDTDWNHYTNRIVVPAPTEDDPDAVLYFIYVDAVENGPVVISGKNFMASLETPSGEGEYLWKITNSMPYELPKSGGIGTNVFTMGGLLMIGMSLLLGLCMRRKRERRTE